MDHRLKIESMPCFTQLCDVLAVLGVREGSERGKVGEFCTFSKFDKDESLHLAGDIADEIFFICSGLVRLFYMSEDGKELNKSFSLENQFVGALQYSEKPEPSRFYIQAIEPTQTLAISLDGLNSLYRHSLDWANLGRRYMEDLAVRKSNREAEFLLDSAETRYINFLKENPTLATRLPLFHIASFLGITDVALSRIRRRITK